MNNLKSEIEKKCGTNNVQVKDINSFLELLGIKENIKISKQRIKFGENEIAEIPERFVSVENIEAIELGTYSLVYSLYYGVPEQTAFKLQLVDGTEILVSLDNFLKNAPKDVNVDSVLKCFGNKEKGCASVQNRETPCFDWSNLSDKQKRFKRACDAGARLKVEYAKSALKAADSEYEFLKGTEEVKFGYTNGKPTIEFYKPEEDNSYPQIEELF